MIAEAGRLTTQWSYGASQLLAAGVFLCALLLAFDATRRSAMKVLGLGIVGLVLLRCGQYVAAGDYNFGIVKP